MLFEEEISNAQRARRLLSKLATNKEANAKRWARKARTPLVIQAGSAGDCEVAAAMNRREARDLRFAQTLVEAEIARLVKLQRS